MTRPHPIPAEREGCPPTARLRGAFTLVEVLIVIAVLAIAAAVVTPRLGPTDQSKLRSAANVLIADVEFAQSESIAHGDAPRVLAVDAGGASYRIATAAAPTAAITNPVGKLPYVTTFGFGRGASLSGVTISAYSLGGDNRVGFGLYGQLDQTAAATLTLACGGRTLMLTLDPTTGEATAGAIQ